MVHYSLFVRLEAKPGKESEVAALLQSALDLAQQESRTPLWFALKFSDNTFGVFDAFEDEAARQAHLQGPIAQALAKSNDLFARPFSIERMEILGLKNQPL